MFLKYYNLSLSVKYSFRYS